MPLVFAYGSNLHRTQMRERCPRALAIGRAELPGVRLAFAGYSMRWGGGVATVELSDSGRLHGAIYSVDESELRRLDSYEGAPFAYARLNTSALLYNDGDRVECSVELYMLLRDAASSRPPSREYLSTIERGYEHFKLPVRALRRAVARARAEAHP